MLDKFIAFKVDFPVNFELYPSFYWLGKMTDTFEELKEISANEEFIEYLKALLDTPEIKRCLYSLRTVRDKFISHNEHDPSIAGLEQFWIDCLYLHHIANLYLTGLGKMYFEIHFTGFFDPETGKNAQIQMQAYWIVKFLETKIEKDKIMKWWI